MGHAAVIFLGKSLFPEPNFTISFSEKTWVAASVESVSCTSQRAHIRHVQRMINIRCRYKKTNKTKKQVDKKKKKKKREKSGEMATELGFLKRKIEVAGQGKEEQKFFI